MKKTIKFMEKKGICLIIIFALMLAYFMPIVPVIAVSSTTALSVSFRDDNKNYGKVQYSLDGGANWNDITNDVQNMGISVSVDNLRLKIVPNNNYSVDYAGIELNLDETTIKNISNLGFETENGYSVPSDIQSVSLIHIEFRENVNNNNGGQNGNNISSKVTVNISGEELEYDMPWSEDAADFVFGINGSELKRLSKNEVNYKRENDKIVGLETKNQFDYMYNYNDEGTVTFNIRTQWDDVITSLKINNVLYNTPQTKDKLIESFSYRGIGFNIPNVPYSSTYNIEVIGRKQTEDEKIMGNFGWTYDPNTNEFSDDDKIPYGNLEFVKAVYNNKTYNTIDEVNAAGGTFEWNDGVKGTDDPTGEAMFPTGTELTLRLTPDAGYQLTSLDLNGTPFEPGEEVGLYTFTIRGGNWHLGAQFTEVSDEVQTNSVNIKSGDIDINKSKNNDFKRGTAKLEVNDIESLSSNRIKEFENTADNEGYELENYLDISLYNTVYKGGSKDSSGNYESWDTPVENIEDNATITLELEKDMKGKELAIVHEKHSGETITGYELIDAIYNRENNTISFKADSFSNYAIVSKEADETEKYILTSGDATFVFTDEANHNFDVTFMDVLKFTDEQLESLGITKTDFVQILKIVKENTSKYGALLSVYAIEIGDTNRTYTGKTEVKIKMTDEMKKYNSFKLIYLDENNNFKVEDIIDFKVEGDYIIGTLPHLSAYALVGSNVEISPSTDSTTNKTNNPKTGDNIKIWIGLMAFSMVGILFTIKSIKKK